MQIKDACQHIESLEARLGSSLSKVKRPFKLRAPWQWIDKINPNDPNDPILRQILPVTDEEESADWPLDAVEDQRFNPLPSVVHKYASRALITTTGACAIHCRYCFRQHFNYSANVLTPKAVSAIIGYLATHPDIDEIVLSGGDPLTLGTEKLSSLIEPILAMPQITTLRIHSRTPVVIPERLTKQLRHWLSELPKQVVLVLHVNHAQEIDDNLANYLRPFGQLSNLTLLNQSVLLRGVNDDAAALAALSRALFQIGVLPYYLHLLDKVAGTRHFWVEDARAISIYQDLQAMLPGYLVPKLARDNPGEPSKSLIV